MKRNRLIALVILIALSSMLSLVTVLAADAQKVRLVMDNLNTHSIRSLYEAFDPEKALRLVKHLEIRFTPKHGSRLNIAEIELNVMTLQCQGRRIPDILFRNHELAA